MNIKDIFHNLKSHISNITSASLNIPNKKLYIVVFVISLLFFMVVTFPYESIIYNQIEKNKDRFARDISVSNLNFSFFSGISADRVSILTTNNIIYKTNSISFNPEFLSLLRKIIITDISINNLTYQKQDFSINGNYKINTNITLNKDYYPTNGMIKLSAEDILISKISFSGFNFNQISISKLDATLNFSNNSLIFKNFYFTGKDLKGVIRGSIKLNKVINNSILNLSVEIDKNSQILKDFEMFLTPFINTDSGKIIIEITGNMRHPSVMPKRYYQENNLNEN